MRWTEEENVWKYNIWGRSQATAQEKSGSRKRRSDNWNRLIYKDRKVTPGDGWQKMGVAGTGTLILPEQQV